MLSIVPEMNLGISIMWNGPLEEFSVIDPVMDILIPAFHSVLLSKEPKPKLVKLHMKIFSH